MRGMNIELYDEQVKPENLLATQGEGGQRGAVIEKRIMVGHRQWVLRVSEPEPSSLSPLSRLALIFTAVTALLLLLIVWLISRRAIEDRRVLEWQQREVAIRTALTHELNHRVKNTLANVLSIIALTRRRRTNLEDFTQSLTERVRALSATHDLLTASNWGMTSIKDLVSSELAPYAQGEDSPVTMHGPDINLAPNDALSLGLAVHELATNAAKYGALSVLGGKVEVAWRMVGDDIAEIEWRECGGPAVVPPRKRGFGRDLMEKIVPYNLRSSVELRFEPNGVECVLRFPVRQPAQFSLRRDRAAANSSVADSSQKTAPGLSPSALPVPETASK
jgi:two-component sensor histidine kinase